MGLEPCAVINFISTARLGVGLRCGGGSGGRGGGE